MLNFLSSGFLQNFKILTRLIYWIKNTNLLYFRCLNFNFLSEFSLRAFNFAPIFLNKNLWFCSSLGSTEMTAKRWFIWLSQKARNRFSDKLFMAKDKLHLQAVTDVSDQLTKPISGTNVFWQKFDYKHFK